MKGIGPSNLININGTLFFTVDMLQGTPHSQLWKSDGTAAGTTLVKEINNPHLLEKLDPYQLVNMNGQLFFAPYSNVGYELWKSDGTATGTTLVKDINGPVNDGSFPLLKTNFKGQLFFVADDSIHGNELWKSDGSTAGTTLVKDLAPGAADSRIYQLLVIGQTLFFIATDGLWKSDGTTGTTLVKPFTQPVRAVSAPSMAIRNGNLFFLLSEAARGAELWRSNCTTAGTTLVKSLKEFGDGTSGALTNIEGRLFFYYYRLPSPDASCCTPAADTVYGLWTSDGTTVGTIPASTLLNVDSPEIVGMNGSFFFGGRRGQTYGLWKSQGTPNSTVLLKQNIFRHYRKVIGLNGQ